MSIMKKIATPRFNWIDVLTMTLAVALYRHYQDDATMAAIGWSLAVVIGAGVSIYVESTYNEPKG